MKEGKKSTDHEKSNKRGKVNKERKKDGNKTNTTLEGRESKERKQMTRGRQ